MKRKILEDLVNTRAQLTGTFEKFGVHSFENNYIITMLFVDVYINGRYIDHIWVRDNTKLREQNIKEGSVVSFTCLIKPYNKSNNDGYGVKSPRSVTIECKGKGKSLVQFLNEHRNVVASHYLQLIS